MCCWPRVCTLTVCRRLQAAVLLLGVSVYLLSIAFFTATSSTLDSSNDPDNSSVTLPRGHCLQKTCVFKCCPEKEVFQSEYNSSCITPLNSTNSSFIENVSVLLNQYVNSSDVLVFHNRCTAAREVLLASVALQEDGSVLIEDLQVTSDEACFEFALDSGLLVLVVGDCVEAVDNDHTLTQVKDVILLVCSTTSTVALVIVILTYACLPKLRNLQGKLLICYLIPMTLFNLNFVAVDVMPGSWLTEGVICLVQRLNTLFLFGWLTWLTIMCHEIWSTFSRPLQSADACRHSDRRKFVCYSLVGWGCPVVHVVALEVFAADLPGLKRAVVDNFTYNAISLNLVMFLSTLTNMSLHHTPHGRFDPRSSRKHRHATSNSEGVFLYLKLALLMGSDWFAVLASSAFNSDILYYLSLILLELQGVFLFILLICNGRVRSLLVKTWLGASRPGKMETTSTSV